MARLTLATVKTELSAIGYSITKRDGEYRVYRKGGEGEGMGYFTDCLQDALDTGRDMARRANSVAAPVVKPSVARREAVRVSTTEELVASVATMRAFNRVPANFINVPEAVQILAFLYTGQLRAELARRT